MAESPENSGAGKITITIKTPKEKHDVQVSAGGTVKEVCLKKETNLAVFSKYKCDAHDDRTASI